VYADAAYTNYALEARLAQEGIQLRVQRKATAERLTSPCQECMTETMSKRIASSISEVKGLFLGKLHAVSLKGFLIKVLLFLLAFRINKAYLN